MINHLQIALTFMTIIQSIIIPICPSYNLSNSLDVILPLHANSMIKLPCLLIAVEHRLVPLKYPFS